MYVWLWVCGGVCVCVCVQAYVYPDYHHPCIDLTCPMHIALLESMYVDNSVISYKRFRAKAQLTLFPATPFLVVTKY